jgi:dihydroflavonol-4-reductase
MKIAVTGASGHIGNVICRQLIDAGHEVNALYNKDKKALEDISVRAFQGSVLHKTDLAALIEGCEVVVNCAAVISITGDPNGTVFRTNTEGPRNIVDVSLDKGVKKIIHFSSVHAVTELPHSDPYNETRPYKAKGDIAYDYSKAAGEQIILEGAKDKAIEIVVVRPSCVVGPHDFKPSKMGAALIDLYKEKLPFLPPGGYDIVDVRDVASSAIRAIEKGKSGEIYLLSGRYVDFPSLAKAIHAVAGKKVPKTTIPFWLLYALVPLAALYFKISGMSPSLTKESILALKHGHPRMDNSKAARELNHEPRELEETLRDFFQWNIERKIL